MSLLRRNLKKCGRDITLIKHSDLSEGKSYRARDKTLDISTSVKGTFKRYKSNDIDGEYIKATDKKVLVDGVDQPDLSDYDEINDGSLNWKIKSVEVFLNKNSNLLYIFQVRR